MIESKLLNTQITIT